MTSIKLYEGNCLDVLRKCPDNYMDSIVTDPPYGLSFMSKAWDYSVPSTEIWKECLRVLKPGGHLLAFGGTRTYHRLVVNIEDAGFEIRDQIMWIYGSGFPKSQNIALAIDKQLGVESINLGADPNQAGRKKNKGQVSGTEGSYGDETEEREAFLKEPASEAAKKWSGYGTALKPANEPICLARKPLSEKTVAKNVLKHGTGGLNVDASRIETDEVKEATSVGGKFAMWNTEGNNKGFERHNGNGTSNPLGRFPSNLLFDEFAAAVLDEQSGVLKSGARKGSSSNTEDRSFKGGSMMQGGKSEASEGAASRFFYVAKASKKDRGEGNTHPTVKPIKLMEYLIKLVTPEGGIVLDPFMGSGTTGVAARNLGFGFRGIEMSPEYFKIAQQRILGASEDVA